jgi:UDP-glucose 4-epimerase
MLRTFHTMSGLSYAALRYANVYGPRQDPHGEAGVVAIFTRQLLAGNEAIVNGDGQQTRDFVYVADVAEANALALTSQAGGAFNVGTGKETSVNEIFRLLQDLTGSRQVERHGPAKAGEQRRSAVDATRIGRELGWRPTTALRDGLAETVAYFRAEIGASRPGSAAPR